MYINHNFSYGTAMAQPDDGEIRVQISAKGIDIADSFPADGAASAWSWGYKCVEPYHHAPTRLDGAVKHKDNFTFINSSWRSSNSYAVGHCKYKIHLLIIFFIYIYTWM